MHIQVLSDNNLVGGLSPTKQVGYQTEFQIITVYNMFKSTSFIPKIIYHYLNNKNHHPVMLHLSFSNQTHKVFLNIN